MYRLKTILTCVIFLISSSSFSQGESDNWYIGIHAALTFKNGFPENLPNHPLFISTLNGVSLSDSAGTLMFYASENQIRNKNLLIMLNGYGLMGQGCCNQFISARNPLHKNLNYLFTTGNRFNWFDPLVGCRYSIIDMNLDGGLGAVIEGMKNIPLTGCDSCVVQLTGTKHNNNKDSWIIAMRHGKILQYMAYLIDSAGVHNEPVISNSGIISDQNWSTSTLRVSPDGKNIILTDSLLEVSAFDTKTGVVTPKFIVDPSVGLVAAVFGTEFSIESRYLYVVSGDTLLQFDMTKDDSLSFMQSRVAVSDSVSCYLGRAPDGKIYFGNIPGHVEMGVIHNPSAGGLACNVQLNYFFTNADHNQSIPQYIQNYKAYVNHNKIDCINDTIHYTTDIWPPADSIHWDFGDPASGAENFSNSATPSHFFSGPGTYTVELWVRHIDKRTDTTWQIININTSPQVQLGNDRSICIGDSVVFDAGACAGCTFEWKNLATGVVVGTNQTYTVTTAGSYRVLVTNTDNCRGSDTVSITFSPPPQITTNPLSKTICNGESTNILLASTVGNTMYHWTASLTSGIVTGFSADSGLAINQILSGAGVVNYNIIPKVGNCVGDTVDFVVTVTPGDSVKVSVSADLNNICAGTSVTYTATPTGPGILSYQWKVNGIASGTNNPSFSYIPSNNDIVSCILSSSETICVANNPATSNSVTMVVDPLVPVSVSVSPSQNNICQGTSVTFTATPSPLSANHNYQWTVNGINSGADQNTFIYSPNNNDVVKCNLNVSGLSCLTNNPDTSQPVTMIVNPILTPDVTVTALPVPPVCGNISVTFTAHPVNGGLTPAYQWFVNGNPAGINLSYSFTPANNDMVVCSMNSSAQCLTTNPVSSIPFQVPVITPPVVTYTICTDSIITTNAKPIKLKGGIPLGGTYSGPGVNSVTGMFTPSIAGVGIKTINYTYTNAGLCTSSANSKLQIVNSSASICGNPFTDVRDGTVYKTIQLAGQCWFAEDLNYGTEIPVSKHQLDNCSPEKYTHSSSLIPHSCYQWDELMQYTDTPGEKGLCPPAWHVPTEAEWNTLFSNWTNSGFAASPLKYSGFSGFNAILSGVTHQNVQYDYVNFATFYWSSTPHGPTKAWAHGMNDPDPSVSRYPASRSNGFNVRCLRD